MKGSSRTSTRRLVKNKVMPGDSRLNMTVKPENRNFNLRATASSAASDNYYLSQIPDKFSKVKSLGTLDGSGFKREIGAKKNRAAQVYGSTKAALKVSYRKDKATGQVLPGSEYKTPRQRKSEKQSTNKGGLRTDRPRDKNFI